MGTQVSLLALVKALAGREDVREVAVMLASQPPDYAAGVFSRPGVNVWIDSAGELSRHGMFDVAHRPFHPDPNFDPARLRKVARRLVLTVHDLIAYEIGDYHASPDLWLDYKESFAGGLAAVDAVVASSDDSVTQIQMNRLPLDYSRLSVVHLGTDHLTGGEEAEMPSELAARGFAAGEFLLTLGTNYSHKNRDLAIGASRELQRRGRDLALVMAGAHVPFGSSRVLESEAGRGIQNLFVLPDVSSPERNWLLSHAVAVLLPTAAEGFGLIAHEAAKFGTPTINVGFGSLKETGGPAAITAADWGIASLANAVEALLDDPVLGRAQLSATIEGGKALTWALTAEKLTSVYRWVLSRPSAFPTEPANATRTFG